MFFFLVFLLGSCVGVLTSMIAMFKIGQKDLKNELDDDHIIHGTYDCFDER